MRGIHAFTTAGVALSLVAMGGAAMAGEATVTDPTNDTAMGRGGPDLVSTRVTYAKRIAATLRFANAPEDLGTINGVNLTFKNGRSYTLQRHAADPGFQTPLKSEIVLDTGVRVSCKGVSSSVNRSRRTVTVSAPTKCFNGKNTRLKAQGFSFTRNFDTDETRWTKWVAKEPTNKGKKKKVTYQVIRLGESPITAVQTDDTRRGGKVKNTNAVANFSGLRCVDGKCKGAGVAVTATLTLQRRVDGKWSTVSSLPAAGTNTVVAPTLRRAFLNGAVVRYVWSGRATLGNDRAPFKMTSDALKVR